MKIGVVGAGRIGSVHARNLAGMVPAGSLLIHDADPAVAGKAAAEVDGSVRPTAEAVLADADALVVATPATDRLPLLDAAMARGIPVFCEKPLAAGLPEARHIAATARRLSARVLVGFQRRFDPEYLMLHRLVASGAAGQVLMIRGTAFDRTLPSEGYRSTAGDLFTDCLIHDIDATRWIAQDEIVSVQADTQQIPHPRSGEGRAEIGVGTVVLTLAHGGTAVLTASRLDPSGYDHRMEVLGTGESAVAGLGAASLLRAPRTAAAQPGGGEAAPRTPGFDSFIDRFAEAYRAEMRAFLTMAEGGGPSPCGPVEAVRAQEIAAAAAVAARTGTRQGVAPFGQSPDGRSPNAAGQPAGPSGAGV